MKKFLSKMLLVATVLFSVGVSAQYSSAQFDVLTKNDEDFNSYDHYYKIVENLNSNNIDLMKFDDIQSKFPTPQVPYNRDTHFGGWLRDTTDGTCLNTRGKVLARDSVTNVTYTQNGCTVDRGEWADPYTASTFKSSRDIQIDHVVALKNAYMTGAFEWDFKKRCLYANYLGNNFHLLSVYGKENLKKSDHTPKGYVPPNKSFTCDFLKTWLNVKLIWSLRITPVEASAITQVAKDSNCDPQAFNVSGNELAAQREFMESHANLCSSPEVTFEKF